MASFHRLCCPGLKLVGQGTNVYKCLQYTLCRRALRFQKKYLSPALSRVFNPELKMRFVVKAPFRTHDVAHSLQSCMSHVQNMDAIK